jgi:NAD(P)H-dependent FMN reductase|tara:strand:- start:953 stop:1465 length:513 start_codon:yes stop_codon:yes gene_type:complete
MQNKVLIVSATSSTNLKLSEDIEKILQKFSVKAEILNIEEFPLPLFVSSNYIETKEKHFDKINNLTGKFIESHGIIICAPEYNGSIPPIITNMIAWISVSTEEWRFAFSDKISLIATSSGGPGSKYIIAMKNQLEHLGSVVMPRSIATSSSVKLDLNSVEKILNKFIKLL